MKFRSIMAFIMCVHVTTIPAYKVTYEIPKTPPCIPQTELHEHYALLIEKLKTESIQPAEITDEFINYLEEKLIEEKQRIINRSSSILSSLWRKKGNFENTLINAIKNASGLICNVANATIAIKLASDVGVFGYRPNIQALAGIIAGGLINILFINPLIVRPLFEKTLGIMRDIHARVYLLTNEQTKELEKLIEKAKLLKRVSSL